MSTAQVQTRAQGLCTRCEHPEGPHKMVAPGDPLQGGVMLCPVEGCECFGTWGVPQGEPEQAHCGWCDGIGHRAYQHPGLSYGYVREWLADATPE